MDIAQLLTFAVKRGASDLHLSAGLPPMVRVDGDMRRISLPALTAEHARTLIHDAMSDRQRHDYETSRELDFAMAVPGLARFRVNAFYQHRGVGAVFRVIPTTIMCLDQLHGPPVLTTLCRHRNGLVLVTGPTGSGKSTTLAAMLDDINTTDCGHILTIEDPIEFVHTSKRCLVNQREVHRDTHGFTQALRAALREDPDVILVGELRDLDTMRLALSAAETGHLVFGTLHTRSAAQTVNRIIEVFPATERALVRSMLSASLRGVVSQTLLKRRGGGRCAAYEIMIGIPAVRHLIREDNTAQLYSAIQTGGEHGMQTLEHSVKERLSQGMITAEVAKAHERLQGEY